MEREGSIRNGGENRLYEFDYHNILGMCDNLKAAHAIGVSPSRCIVFEDALHGIEAAQRAGMKVVAMATTHSRKELMHVDMAVKDFTQVDLEMIKKLM